MVNSFSKASKKTAEDNGEDQSGALKHAGVKGGDAAREKHLLEKHQHRSAHNGREDPALAARQRGAAERDRGKR